MKVLSLQGEHYSMGLQHGQQVHPLRPLIIAVLGARLEALSRCGGLKASLLEEVERAWQENSGPTMAFLRGMAEALMIPTYRLFQYALASYLEDVVLARSQADGCTVWAASGPATHDGSPILAKNRDHCLGHLPLRVVVRARPHQGYCYLYITSAGSPAVFSSGMNEKGLTVADTHVSSRDAGPGLARYTLMMNLLEQQATVATALTYLQEVSHMGGGNLILADAGGDLAVCESGYRRCGFISPVKSTIVATNHFVSTELRDCYLEHAPGAYDESQTRYQAMQSMLKNAQGKLDTEMAGGMMTRHDDDGAVAICRHRPKHDADTISTAIYLPAERRLLFSNGRPCETTPVAYSL
jgi:isopenicillin-N N-acyltransferase-like protein